MIQGNRIPGQNKASIMLYALSTCAMCNGVKRLLNDMGVAYSYIDVDLLDRDEKENTKAEMRKWHPKCPFPLLVINNNTCVIGNEPEQIKEAIGA